MFNSIPLFIFANLEWTKYSAKMIRKTKETTVHEKIKDRMPTLN